ncbi:MAG: polysaccharide biosynthesis C-terminal domain-containing protein [Oscillospiraceae bacterium]|nr:polysaccharide biosynthesis C-terminal domain-containing protein [Oscillospiraceae bacterium]
MRTKNIYISAAVGLIEELVAIVCGFVLPRMILLCFGSNYNGIVATVTQFIGCIALLKSGIGMATKAALYSPLHNNDKNKVSGIMAATMKFLRKVAMIFVLGIVIFACIYPLCMKESFTWGFTASLVLIISLGTFFQYYFGLGNQLLLEADQKYYIISIITIINTLFNTIISVICMKMGMSIHGVKLCSAVVYCSTPIFLNYYVNKKYKLDRKAKPDWESISKRWDAFGMQIANFVNTNTDVIIASLFLDMKEVSVYTVYYLVINGVKKVISRVSAGVESALGNLKAEMNKDKLKNRFQLFEFVLNIICIIAFSCLIILIVPFVKIYTTGVSDVNYSRFVFAVVASLAELFFCLRLAYTYMVQAVGAFSETKKYSYIEALLNIICSVVMVKLFGLIGIVAGTLIAMFYRTIVFAYYVYNQVIYVNIITFWKRISITLLCIMFNGIVGVKLIQVIELNNYFQWTGIATLILLAVVFFTTMVHYFLYRNLFNDMVKVVFGKLKR